MLIRETATTIRKVINVFQGDRTNLPEEGGKIGDNSRAKTELKRARTPDITDNRRGDGQEELKAETPIMAHRKVGKFICS